MLFLIPQYLFWHYGNGVRDFLKVWKNFLWFILHFFSFEFLLRTLFTPVKRMGEAYAKGLQLEAMFETFVLNTILRFVGLFLRLATICVGFLIFLISIIVGAFLFLVWFFLPVIVVMLFVNGIFFLFL